MRCYWERLMERTENLKNISGIWWERLGNFMRTHWEKWQRKNKKNPGLTFLWMKKSCKALLLHVDEEILQESSYGWRNPVMTGFFWMEKSWKALFLLLLLLHVDEEIREESSRGWRNPGLTSFLWMKKSWKKLPVDEETVELLVPGRGSERETLVTNDGHCRFAVCGLRVHSRASTKWKTTTTTDGRSTRFWWRWKAIQDAQSLLWLAR